MKSVTVVKKTGQFLDGTGRKHFVSRDWFSVIGLSENTFL